ncbi:sensor histidine kinase [Parachitinimonas caeni]|uniref:Histidine kinase n=1 Tax=Parachitinimonas caeni TaxID=3031301 RepID=A0ABT7E0R0_9NEIS|nr:histidine kinase [Parachitinimonas caeni]MDK2125876.1 histidine kinase [Parachitinimonas caeni]
MSSEYQADKAGRKEERDAFKARIRDGLERKIERATKGDEVADTFQQLERLLVRIWWQFFDWLAVVPWGRLAIVSLLVMIATGVVSDRAAGPVVFLILMSFVIKIVAGGKVSADKVAAEATAKAETEQLERNVLEARLEALQAQIEPHFLFNTLASIDQLIQMDPPRASQMQQSLIRYLRSAMPKMREGRRPTLGQQVDLSSAYLEIMQVRMEERLQRSVNVPDGLRSAAFPSMMLQTLVENSIKHGLEPKSDGGQLAIAAEIRDGRLEVSVTDTGMGFAPKGVGGCGLANIRERLKVLYGKRAELIISVPASGGTRALIRVPYEVILDEPEPADLAPVSQTKTEPTINLDKPETV